MFYELQLQKLYEQIMRLEYERNEAEKERDNLRFVVCGCPQPNDDPDWSKTPMWIHYLHLTPQKFIQCVSDSYLPEYSGAE